MNITLDIDEDVVRKVRKIARDKDTTLSGMVNDYLTGLVQGDADARQERVLLLEDSFRRISRDMGAREWKREDLHVRAL